MAKKKQQKIDYRISRMHVSEYEFLNPHLNSLYNELKVLSQKKPNEQLNELKVKMINKVLLKVKNLLEVDSLNEFTELLDEDSLPSNSDALFMIVQFQTAMNRFKEINQYEDEENEDEFGNFPMVWSTKD